MSDILIGHCMAVLRTLPAESMQCCVTSPPYWGLRAYGTEPQVWGGENDCPHEWTTCPSLPTKLGAAGNTQGEYADHTDDGKAGGYNRARPEPSAFCHLCGAWRGELAEALERRREGSACVVVGELSAQVRRLEGENAALRAELCGASDRAFHSTSTDRLASILEHGLLPCSEPQYFSAPAPYVMLSRAPWADLHGDRTVVLALRMPGLVWDDDEGCRWGEPISPDHIEWVMFSGQAARLAEARLGQPGRVGAPTGRGARGGDADYRGDNES